MEAREPDIDQLVPPVERAMPAYRIGRDNRSRVESDKRTEHIEPRRSFHDASVNPTPTRARRPSDASVDPTDARKDAGHARAVGGTELSARRNQIRGAGAPRQGS
jgi:hypothetical protein